MESKLGQGSSFHFTAGMSVGTKTSSTPTEDLSLTGIPVLVVDDNFTNRRILTEMFWMWQMKPTEAASGQEALSHLRHASEHGDPFSLVVTDVHMPEMDGFDLARQVKQTPNLADVVIMMLTSGETRGDVQRSRDLGVSAHLMKPVRRAELRAAITRALQDQSTSEHQPEAPSDGSLLKAYTSPPSRILLAEDNPVNQRLAARILEKAGHSVLVVGNGKVALAALARETFDLVLMDVQMPEMDGLETTRTIRKDEIDTHRHMPIIAMTAHAMIGDRERCLEAGMDGYLSKPIRALDLLNFIERIRSGEAAVQAVVES